MHRKGDDVTHQAFVSLGKPATALISTFMVSLADIPDIPKNGALADLWSHNGWWVIPVLGVAGTAATFFLGGLWWGISFIVLAAVLLITSLARTLAQERRRTADLARRLSAGTPEVQLPTSGGRTASQQEASSDDAHGIESVSTTRPRETGPFSEEHDFFVHLFAATSERDVAKVDELTKQWVSESDSQPERLRREALRLRLLIDAGQSDSIHGLISLADDHPESVAVLSTLAAAFDGLGEPERAVLELQSRANLVPALEVSGIYVLQADLLRQQRRHEESVAAAEYAVSEAADDKTKCEALRALGLGLYELGHTGAAMGALEEAAQLDPSATGIRWDLAWKYSELGYHELSVMHYDLLTAAKPENPTYRNNLAVELHRLGLSISSFESYKQAVELGSALGASNIVNLLLNVGAASLADEWLSRGQECSEHDERLEEAAARRAKDERSQNEERDEARKRATVLRRAMMAMSPSTEDGGLPTGSWLFDDGTTVEFVPDGATAIGSGQYQGNPLRVSLVQSPQGVLSVTWKEGEYGSTYSGIGRKKGDDLFLVLNDHPTSSRAQAFHASQTNSSSDSWSDE